MNQYNNGDYTEDISDILLNTCWNKPFTKINRRKNKDGSNAVQIIKVNGETFILPDIEVYRDLELNEIILRIEVKSFASLPKVDSPNKSLPLFPIKIRQLSGYVGLQSAEEIGIKFIIVVGKKNENFYWCELDELLNDFGSIRHDWKKEDSLWFNI